MAEQTDREALLALLTRFGLEPDFTEASEPGDVPLRADHGNVLGYGGFVAIFSFDTDGSFKSVGVWE